MVRYYFLFIFFFTGFVFTEHSNAQKSQTLMSSDIRHGGFGAPIFGATSVNGEAAYLRGFRGAWIINLNEEHAVQLGLAGYRTESDFSPHRWSHTDIEEPDMKTHYRGFELEYTNRTYRLVHFSIQTLVGSGTVRYQDEDEVNLNRTSDNYFALQPGMNINLNITDWFKLSGGLFYRYAGGVNLSGTSDTELSGFTSFVALRFGKF